MVLRAREVLEQVAVALGRHDPQVDPEAPGAVTTVAFVVPRATTLEPTGSPTKCADQRRRVRGGGDQVEIAEALAPPPHAARFGDAIAAGCARSSSTSSRTTGSPEPSSPRGLADRPRRPPAPAAPSPRSSAPNPEKSRSRRASAALARPASVVIPSSDQIRAAVFGPTPGSRMNARRPRHPLPPAGEGMHLAVLDHLHDLLLDRGADPRQLLRLARDRELGDRATGCRGCGSPHVGRQ